MKMKAIEILKIIMAVLVLWSAYVFWKTNYKDGGPVTKKEFKAYENEFRQEMDTLNFKLDRNSIKIDTLLSNDEILKLNIDSLKIDNDYIFYNLDSIKKGQIIIYRKLSKLKEEKTEDKKFIEKLKKWF